MLWKTHRKGFGMNTKKQGLLIGLVIVAVGLVSLLANMEVLRGLDNIANSGFFLVLAYLFFTVYSGNKMRWWALLVAIIFAIIGFIYFVEIFWNFPDNLIGTIFLWGASVLFGYLYAKEASRWWAVFLSGLFFTLGSINIIHGFALLRSDQEGIVFFIGLALTFVYLWSQRDETYRWNWALYPAAGLFIIAFLIFIETESWMGLDYVVPVLLIAVGSYLLIRSNRLKAK